MKDNFYIGISIVIKKRYLKPQVIPTFKIYNKNYIGKIRNINKLHQLLKIKILL